MIKLVIKLVSDERGVFTTTAFIFFLAAFGVFGTVLSVKYLASQKERALGAAEAAAVTTIRAIHEGRRGQPIDSIVDAKAFAKAAMVAFSDGTDLDGLLKSNIPKVSEFADKTIDVKLYPYPDDIDALVYTGDDSGSSPAPALTEVTDLADVGLVVIEVHFTEARKSSLSAGFYNLLSPRRNLSVQAIGAAFVPSCSQTGLYSASEIKIDSNLIATGPSCIRTDRLYSELASLDNAPTGEMNINVAGLVHFRNILPGGIISESDPVMALDANQVEISAPYKLGLSANVPDARFQERTWRVKEFYDFQTIYNWLSFGLVDNFFPDYLTGYAPGKIGKKNRITSRKPTGSEPVGVNIIEPDKLVSNSINEIVGCGDDHKQVRLAAGVYEDVLILTNCRLIVSDNVTLKNMSILSSAKPAVEKTTDGFGIETRKNFPSVRIQSDTVGDQYQNCSTHGSSADQGVLIWTGVGNIETEQMLNAYDTQFIMGSLPRNYATGEEPAPLEVIEKALAVDDNGKITNTFQDRVSLRGSSITSLYPTHFKESLYLTGCMQKNLSNRHFRPYFRQFHS